MAFDSNFVNLSSFSCEWFIRIDLLDPDLKNVLTRGISPLIQFHLLFKKVFLGTFLSADVKRKDLLCIGFLAHFPNWGH